MVAPVLILTAVVPLLLAFARTTAFGIESIKASFAPMNSRIARWTAMTASLTVITAIGVSLVMMVLPRLPDFRTAGDGGVGMAYNAISKIAVVLMIPAVTCVLVGVILRTRNGNHRDTNYDSPSD